MNILRGIGTALTSYGYGETERRREEALKAEKEAEAARERQRRGEFGVQAMKVGRGTTLPGTPEAEAFARIAGEMGQNPNTFFPDPDAMSNPIRSGAGYAQINLRTGEGRPVTGVDVPTTAPEPTKWERLPDASGRVWERDPQTATTRPVLDPAGNPIIQRVPGADSSTDRGLPTLQYATEQLMYKYGIVDSKTNKIIDFKIPEDDIHRLAAMAARGEWALGTPLPASVNMNRRESRFQGVMDSAMRGVAVPEPVSRAHLGPTAFGVRGGGSVAPGPGMAGAPSLEEQARQLRALGYSEEQIRITLGTGR